MNKWILMFVAAAAYAGARHMGWVSPTFEVQGPPGPGQVLIADADYKATFTVEDTAEETYMLFGGNVSGSTVAHAWLDGLELATARRIGKKYPDFHMCKSPGALDAIRALRDVRVVADRRTLAKVGAAVKEHEARLGKGAERLCATVRGQRLALEKIEIGKQVVTAAEYHKSLAGHADKQVYLYVQELEAGDCKDSL